MKLRVEHRLSPRTVRHDLHRLASQQEAGTHRLERTHGRVIRRHGASTVDYFLVLAIIVPLAAFMAYAVPRIIQLVYEMTVTLVGTPFM